MDFDCDQKNSVHFFYTLPFSKTKALIETTWISDLNNTLLKDYDIQLIDYIENKLKIKNYKINYKETGAIPLFHPNNIKKLNQIEIGTAGGMTRLSTGYTFLNIQEQSKYIRENIENIKDTKIFSIKKKSIAIFVPESVILELYPRLVAGGLAVPLDHHTMQTSVAKK